MLPTAPVQRRRDVSCRGRRGFTLVELVAALCLSGLVLLGAQALLSQLGESGERFAHEAADADARANGVRVLRSLVRHAERGLDSADRFTGDAVSARFTSSCLNAAGSLEPCHVRLVVGAVGDTATLTAVVSASDTLLLWTRRNMAALRYYDAGRREDPWLAEWPASVAVPAAIAIVLSTDTVVLRAGGRE
jgi:prepilin-type N-terminal cleavage/methylation domain-containing protein